jgi:hypothetical protein
MIRQSRPMSWTATIITAVALLHSTPAQAAVCSKITVAAPSGAAADITFTFDAAYTCGQYANGDWWVERSAQTKLVRVTAITPDRGAGLDGWEVNPSSTSKQPYDSRINGYDASQQPALPYDAKAGESLVKTVSVDPADTGCRPCLQFAAVVTVVDGPPPADALRPPYFGADKPTLRAPAQVQPLPKLAASCCAAATSRPLSWVRDRFAPVQLDHKTAWTGRHMHPVDNLPDYGASIATDNATGVLRVMLDDFDYTKADHRQALINLLQLGLDLGYMVRGGAKWPANGGHANGRKLPVLLAGMLLGSQALKDAAGQKAYSEDEQIYFSAKANGGKGLALYGMPCSEVDYWKHIRFGNGNRACKDPYGYIDGGSDEIGAAYQVCCTAKPWKYIALAVRLLQAEAIFANDILLAYADRWVDQGVWAKPDPCAPYDGDPQNYGKTYGPDGNGGCIKGSGRYTAKHGASKDGGAYGSALGDQMWAAFRACTPNCGGQSKQDGGVANPDGGPSVDSGAVGDGAIPDGAIPADGSVSPGDGAAGDGAAGDGAAGDGASKADARGSGDGVDDGCSCGVSGLPPLNMLALLAALGLAAVFRRRR